MIEIDPLEVVIKYLLDQEELTAILGTNISNRHQYGIDWDPSDPGISVMLDGGIPNLYSALQLMRFELRCYARSFEDAMKIYRSLVTISRNTHRELVETQDGTGFLYYFVPVSGPSQLIEPDLNDMPMIMVFFNAQISEEVTA